MIRDHLYVLAVPDLERSASFYRDTLGFSIHEMGDPGWREFGLRTVDGHRIMIGHALP